MATVRQIEWSDQVRNAELLFQRRVVPVGRHLVVATRVNPEASQPSTRKVVVRLWNTDEGTQIDDGSMFAAFLAIHYAAMCRRLGYQQLEELMTFAAQEISRSANASAGPLSHQGDNSLQDRDRRMRELSHNVSNFVRSHQLRRVQGPHDSDELVMLPPGETVPGFRLGERTFGMAFTREALQIMEAIVSPNHGELASVVEYAVHELQRRLNHYQNVEDQNIAVILNGIAVFDRNLV